MYAQKNGLIEAVLLSTHNMCFGFRNKKNDSQVRPDNKS